MSETDTAETDPETTGSDAGEEPEEEEEAERFEMPTPGGLRALA